MSDTLHVHDWQYTEPSFGVANSGGLKQRSIHVLRFCKSCFVYEEKELTTNQ